MVTRIFFVLFVASLMLASTASAQGVMLPREPTETPFELRSYRVEAEIKDHAAVTKVTQVFHNPGPRPAEAVFYFPIPKGAATTDFALWMNGARVQGEVLPRKEARAIYEGIVRRMQDPGLLEYVDSELFQASIFPVPAGGEQQVEIQYAQVLTEQSGALNYRLPFDTRVARRGVQVQIVGAIESSVPMTRLYSPSAALELVQPSPQHARFSFEGDGEGLPSTLEMFITRSSEELSYSLLTWNGEDRGEDGYFMLTFSPGSQKQKLERLPKQVTFVLDTSGSMQGEKWRQAVDALTQGIQALHSDDRYNIIAFSSEVRVAFESPITADARGRARGVTYVEELFARGGTNISGALDAALAQPDERGRPHTVVFLTDGQPTIGITPIPELLAHAERKLESVAGRLFVFGVGYDVNTRLLDTLAEKGRGRSDYVRPNENIGDKFGDLMERISAPLLTSLQLSISGVTVREIYPTVIPDLYDGESVSVFGRFAQSGRATIRLRALSGETPFSKSWTTDFGAQKDREHRFIGNLWANRRVAELMKQLTEAPDKKTEEELVALAVRWNIVTPYTSYLAVDPSEQLQPGPPVTGPPGPVPMPRQMRMEARGGRSALSGGARQMDVQPDYGEAAVERSLAVRGLEEAEVVEEDKSNAAGLRVIEGRRFRGQGQVWVEEGADKKVDRTIVYLSDEWLALQRSNSTMRRILALGHSVRFLHQGQVWEVVRG